MTIKKFQGRTREEATERAKAELGEDAVIMNVKEIVPKGKSGAGGKCGNHECKGSPSERDFPVF